MARFEDLIDQRIAEGIDAKTEQLALEIESVRKELSDRIDANYEDLMAYLRILELELDVLKGQAAGEGAEVPGAGLALTDEARAALAGQVTDEMLDQLRVLMKEDIDDLARRLRDVERAMLDERERGAHRPAGVG